MKNYAGFWKRAGAFALDYLLILVYLLVLSLLFMLLDWLLDTNRWLFGDRIRAQVVAFLLVTFPILLYFAISEASAWQGTWGKRRFNLRVTDRNGARIHFGRALWRTTLKFLPWELSHTLIWQIAFSPDVNSVWIGYGFLLVYSLIGLSLVCLLLSKRNQTAYDLLAGTYVMRLR